MSVMGEGIFYQHLKAEDVADIVEETLVGGAVIERLLYRDPATGVSPR